MDLGLLGTLFPEVLEGEGMTQSPPHRLDVLGHLLATARWADVLLVPEGDDEWQSLREAVWEPLEPMADDLHRYLDEELAGGWSRRALLKLGALLHDVGKPRTRTVAGGASHFHRHDLVGAEIVQEMASRLRLPNGAGAYVVSLVREHMRPVHLANARSTPTSRAVYRFYRDAGDAAWGVALLSACDLLATTGPADRARWRRGLEVLHTLLLLPRCDAEVVRPQRLLSGHEVMEALGIGPGPLVGRALRALEEAQAAGEISSREEASNYLKRWLLDRCGGEAGA